MKFYNIKKIISFGLVLLLVFSLSVQTFADNSQIDFNKDGKIDLLDLVLMKHAIANGSNTETADSNLIDSKNSLVFVPEDLTTMVNILLGKESQFEKSTDSKIDEEF